VKLNAILSDHRIRMVQLNVVDISAIFKVVLSDCIVALY